MRLACILTVLQSAPALRMAPVDWRSAGSRLAVTAATSALLVGSPQMAIALPPSLNDAIVELSEASYPILKAQTANFPPFTAQVGDLFLKIKPDKLAKSIDLGLNVFDSVPADKVAAFTSVVKAEYSGVKTDTCSLVPLPPQSLLEKVKASSAVSQVDSAKFSAFADKWGAAFAALPKTESAICLPSTPASLDTLALAQADVGRAFGVAESKAFGVWTNAMLKSSIGLSDALPLADSAKKLAPSATSAEKMRFEKAGKMIGNAAAGEAAKARVAEQQAAKDAALAKAGQKKAEATNAVDREAVPGMTAGERAKAEAAARNAR